MKLFFQDSRLFGQIRANMTRFKTTRQSVTPFSPRELGTKMEMFPLRPFSFVLIFFAQTFPVICFLAPRRLLFLQGFRKTPFSVFSLKTMGFQTSVFSNHSTMSTVFTSPFSIVSNENQLKNGDIPPRFHPKT